MSRLASNKNTRSRQQKWLRKKSFNEQAGIQQEHKATTTNVIKKKSSNGHASIRKGHTATTNNVVKKKCIQWPGMHPTRIQGHKNKFD